LAAVLNTVVPFDFGAKVVVVLLVVVVFQVVVNLLVVVLLAVVLLVVVVVVVVLAGAKVVVFLLFCLGLFFKSLMIYTKKDMRMFHNLFKIQFSFFFKKDLRDYFLVVIVFLLFDCLMRGSLLFGFLFFSCRISDSDIHGLQLGLVKTIYYIGCFLLAVMADTDIPSYHLSFKHDNFTLRVKFLNICIDVYHTQNTKV